MKEINVISNICTNISKQKVTEESDSLDISTRQLVIQNGLDYLEGTGADLICELCISKGGSCCNGCDKLIEGVGCQSRNTSCTSWLCGFLKYLLYEVELHQEWNSFWNQVPGKNYRMDNTPSLFVVRKMLKVQNLRFLSEALVADLKKIAANHPSKDHIITIREEIDRNLIHLRVWKSNPEKILLAQRNIQILTMEFHHFQKAITEYRKTVRQKYNNKSLIE